MPSDYLDENRVADLEYRRDFPETLSARECAGRAADEIYGDLRARDTAYRAQVRYWPTEKAAAVLDTPTPNGARNAH